MKPPPGRYALFAKRTTFHGFREFHESPTCFQKTLWALVIALCTAMLLVFIAVQIRQFIEGQTATRVSRLDSTEPHEHPPVTLLLLDWSWIDASKVDHYGITYEELQIAKGYMLPKVPYVSNVPVAEAKNRLATRMKAMNVTSVLNFFKQIALDTFDGEAGMHLLADRLTKENALYCVINTTTADPAPFAEAWLFAFFFNFTSYRNNVKELKRKFGDNNFELSMYRPMIFNIDTYMNVGVEPNHSYQIIAEINIYRKIDGCTKDHAINELYYTMPCALDCQLRADAGVQAQTCIPYEKSFVNAIELTESFRTGNLKLCHQGVMSNMTGQPEGREEPEYRVLTSAEKAKRDKEKTACASQCIPRCDERKTTWSVSSHAWNELPGDRSKIEFVFPVANKIVLIEEIQQYEWHDLVSDLGGLLGLWLGASMMSLFQVIQLCCFPVHKSKISIQHSLQQTGRL